MTCSARQVLILEAGVVADAPSSTSCLRFSLLHLQVFDLGLDSNWSCHSRPCQPGLLHQQDGPTKFACLFSHRFKQGRYCLAIADLVGQYSTTNETWVRHPRQEDRSMHCLHRECEFDLQDIPGDLRWRKRVWDHGFRRFSFLETSDAALGLGHIADLDFFLSSSSGIASWKLPRFCRECSSCHLGSGFCLPSPLPLPQRPPARYALLPTQVMLRKRCRCHI